MIRALSILMPLRYDALGNRRSPEWPRVRAEHLALHPRCEVCGTKAACEVHHVVPFHVTPTMELQLVNLLTLCRPHHLLFGHLLSWSTWNPHAKQDAAVWREKIAMRAA